MSIVADVGRSRIAVGGWSRRVDGLVLGEDRSEATLGLQKGFALGLSWRPGTDQIAVSLWAPGPGQAGAIAVENDLPSWLTAVPICSCGEQGCSNASFGFQLSISAGNLPALVDTLQTLDPRPATLTQLKTVPLWEGPCPGA